MRINNKIDLLLIVLINMLTNPPTELINLVVQNTKLHYPIIIGVEIIITIIEYLFYKKFLRTKNVNFLYLAIINNISSYGIGLIYNLLV